MSPKFTKSLLAFFNALAAAVAVVLISKNRFAKFLAVLVVVRRRESDDIARTYNEVNTPG